MNKPNWRNARLEKPKVGDYVVCCRIHSKHFWPSSWEIMAGECEENYYGEGFRVQTDDYSGKGSYAEDWQDIDYWLPADEAKSFMPESPGEKK